MVRRPKNCSHHCWMLGFSQDEVENSLVSDCHHFDKHNAGTLVFRRGLPSGFILCWGGRGEIFRSVDSLGGGGSWPFHFNLPISEPKTNLKAVGQIPKWQVMVKYSLGCFYFLGYSLYTSGPGHFWFGLLRGGEMSTSDFSRRFVHSCHRHIIISLYPCLLLPPHYQQGSLFPDEASHQPLKYLRPPSVLPGE